jgi:hypothetical protein
MQVLENGHHRPKWQNYQIAPSPHISNQKLIFEIINIHKRKRHQCFHRLVQVYNYFLVNNFS